MMVNYVFDQENPDDISHINWPKFHSGVATSLQVSKKVLEKLDTESLRTWIDFQGNQYKSYEHAGLLFGLGL